MLSWIQRIQNTLYFTELLVVKDRESIVVFLEIAADSLNKSCNRWELIICSSHTSFSMLCKVVYWHSEVYKIEESFQFLWKYLWVLGVHLHISVTARWRGRCFQHSRLYNQQGISYKSSHVVILILWWAPVCFAQQTATLLSHTWQFPNL